jgi:hypothetical protein
MLLQASKTHAAQWSVDQPDASNLRQLFARMVPSYSPELEELLPSLLSRGRETLGRATWLWTVKAQISIHMRFLSVSARFYF